MISYIRNLDGIRQKIALSVAILIIVLMLFITYLASSFNTISENTELLKQREWEAMNDFMYLSLAIDKTTLKAMDEMWQSSFLNISTEQNKIDVFVNHTFDVILQSSFLSVILKSKDGEITEVRYIDSNYDELLESVDFSNFPIGEDLVIIDGEKMSTEIDKDSDIKFGEGNRFFFSGKELQSNEFDIFIYVGFHEQVRILDFVSTTDIDLIKSNSNELSKLVKCVSVFMVFIILYGMVLMIVLRHFIVKSLIMFSKCISLDEVLIDRGLLSKEQLDDFYQNSIDQEFDELVCWSYRKEM